MTEPPKTLDPAEIEARGYRHWEEQGLFRPDRREAEPWTIVMPAPNVTGSLPIGHALDITLQDVLIRRERLKGKDALGERPYPLILADHNERASEAERYRAGLAGIG